MKRYRPYCAGYIVLYVLTLLSVADVAYTLYRQTKGINNDLMGSLSFFSYFVFFLAVCYTWQYVRAQVCFDGKKMRVAFPANIRPKQGQARAMILYRQGDLDLKFIDKTIDLRLVTRYAYARDLGYEPIDQSRGGETNKLFPVKEVAIITSDNKRYHMNLGIYSARQRREIIEQMRAVTGIEPEGSLREVLS